MMTKVDHINFWKEQAVQDFDIAVYNSQGGKNVSSLFFYHLAFEKILKAIWVKDNINNTPPFSHDLQKIYGETSLNLELSDFDYLSIISSWNIDTRYPDFKLTLHKRADKSYMSFHESRLKVLFQWLLSQL
jgi:HEPN domain-containing protein